MEQLNSAKEGKAKKTRIELFKYTSPELEIGENLSASGPRSFIRESRKILRKSAIDSISKN